jgi:hypothetical protein
MSSTPVQLNLEATNGSLNNRVYNLRLFILNFSQILYAHAKDSKDYFA